MDFNDFEESKTIFIPYKILTRPQGGAAAGVLGGAIEGALHGSAISSKGAIGTHGLNIKVDEKFNKDGSGPQKVNLIQIEK